MRKRDSKLDQARDSGQRDHGGPDGDSDGAVGTAGRESDNAAGHRQALCETSKNTLSSENCSTSSVLSPGREGFFLSFFTRSPMPEQLEGVVERLLAHAVERKELRVEYLTSSALYLPVDSADSTSNSSVLMACRVTYRPRKSDGSSD